MRCEGESGCAEVRRGECEGESGCAEVRRGEM